ncbi:autotransporter outer membrane beta-barrel domain-containing protein [Morganella morganii]|uniref:autotransporter outer membrane beta-barrel domain-containing protein n=1 Tax=Morganella morganii TaxID=582 RepID=UPI0009B94ACF|nr:autotransporter outer membrane beta-barrel domain-containing protein [Morganella morganii]
MTFKLSQITVLVVSALSVSAGMAATIDKTVQVNNNTPGPVITGDKYSNDTIKYTGSINNSPNTITFVGRESATESNQYYSYGKDHNDAPIAIGVHYDYKYFYSPVEVDTLAITDSSVRINGKANNLTVGGNSVVTITGSDAYSNYRGASYEKPSEFTSSLKPHRNGYNNTRHDEVTITTGNGTYSDSAKQYLDGEHIGDIKKSDNSDATLAIKGTNVTDDRLEADKGEYLVATGDTFNGKAQQHVGERSLSQGATFNGQSSQYLKGKAGKKAVSLDATFTGDKATGQRAGQTVDDNGLAIDSKFDYADQTINTGGVAKGNTIKDGDQVVKGTAEKNSITNGNQTIGAGGNATTNSIDNTTGTHGLQLVSGTATDNTLKNAGQVIEKEGSAKNNVIDNAGADHGIQVVRGKVIDNTLTNTDQRVEKDGRASVKNDITDGSQLVDGFAENNTITNKAGNRGNQVINGTANNNTLTETDQFVGKNGIAGIKNNITNGSQIVEGFAEYNTITNQADKRGEQVISGTADNNKLTNTNQTVKKGGLAGVKNDITDGNQYVGGTAVNNTINNTDAKKPGEQIVSGTATTNLLNNVSQVIKEGGLATDNTLTGNSHLTVENGGEAKNNTLNGDINMIVEANGKATGKTIFNGKNHLDLYAATTNGAYAEDLALSQTKGKSTVTVYEGTQEHDAVTIGKLNGKAAVNFDHRTNPAGHTQMNINNLGNNDPAQYDNTTLDLTLNSNILNGNSDFINTDNAYGQHYVTIIERDTGKEAVLNRPQSADFAYVKNVAGDSNAVFGMKDADGKILDLMDAGTYIHNIQTRTGAGNDTTWSFTATNRLTPGARAVLALSSAPQLMYNNEVDHLRARLHMLRTSDSVENGLWMQGIGNNTKVDKDQVQYKLKHAGLELGADYQLALNSDSKLVLGGFTGFDKGDVKNEWAGTSDIDSYTFGAYATYLNTNGWYADALLKYNHFDNKLKTTSTNGYDVSSDNYSTSVWGMALETGYSFTFSNQTFITPYGQLAYNQMGSKNITLSNEMEAEIKNQRSFTSELGVNAGKDFSFNNGLMFSPYVKAAWNHQYENGNEVEFNRYNTINSDLSGSTGKFGAGFNARYSNMNIFMELQHIAGDAVYSPINGQIGIRYNF